MISTFSPAFQKLKDLRRRRRFIANQIKNGFAFQVRALRKTRNMTQQELAHEAETTQALISRIERNGAANLSVKTLQKIADAFDVALVVRLEPIDRLLQWVDGLSPAAMSPRPSAEILAEMERSTVLGVAIVRETPTRLYALEGRLVSTSAVQRTLPLGEPKLIVSNENSTAAEKLPIRSNTVAA